MLKTLLPALFLFLTYVTQAQYTETFSTPDKGYLFGFADDFSGIDWTLSAWSAQARDASDYFQTTASGVLETIDLDEPVCWESPLLNTGTVQLVSLSVDLTWAGFDADLSGDPCMETGLDYIKVMYSVNGGPFTTAPNVAGGSVCATVGYVNGTPNPPFAGSATVQVGGIPGGSTLQIQVCVNNNSNSEIVTIDNVSVPELGVVLSCSAPALSTAVTPVTCGGLNSGAIDLSVDGGVPGYSYVWSNGSTEEDINALQEGTYTVTVTDAAGCTAKISATVGSAPFAISTHVGPATCTGVSDGEVDLSISGGVPPYTIDWADLPGGSDPEDRFGLEAGSYTVTVTDAGVCTAETSAVVDVASASPYLETFDVAGKGLLPGSVCSGVNANTCTESNFAAVNWSIYGLDTLFGIDAGDHFHTIGGILYGRDFDQVLCWESPLIDISSPGTGVEFSVDVAWEEFDAEPPGPDPLDLIADHIDVEYSLDGGPWVRLANQVGGGLSGHTVVYSNGSGSGQSDARTIKETDLSGNTLRIRVCGYLNSNSETVSVDNVSVPLSVGLYCPVPELSTAVTNVSCFGGSDGAIDLSLAGGSAPFSYLWSNAETTEDLNGLSAGTYTVTVTNNAGQTVVSEASVNQPMLSNAMVNGQDTACLNSTMAYSLLGAFTNFQWVASNNAIIESGQGTDAVMVRWTETGASTLTVYFTNADNCPDTALINLMVDVCVGTTVATLQGVEVQPNPFKDRIRVVFERPTAPGALLQLRDAQGRLLVEQRALTSNTVIETAHFMPGLYLLYITEGSQFGIWKVVKTE